MPRKLLYIVVGCYVLIMLTGCSAQQDTKQLRVNSPSSPVMKDVYTKTVPGDVYSQKNVTPP